MDDTAVAPAWNARARSSFLIAQAMRPRGFITLEAALVIVFALGLAGMAVIADHRDRVITAQRETIAIQAETITLATMRADACVSAVVPAIDTLRKCRAVLEARDEACDCWLAPEGGAQ